MLVLSATNAEPATVEIIADVELDIPAVVVAPVTPSVVLKVPDVNAPVFAVVAPTVPLMLIEAVPVRLVTVPLDGVPSAPPFTTNAPAVPVLTPSAVTTPVPVVVVAGVTPAPPPSTNEPAASAAEDAQVDPLEKYGMPPEVPAIVNAGVVVGFATVIIPPVKPTLVTLPLPLLLNVVQSVELNAPRLEAEAVGTCSVITGVVVPFATVLDRSVPVVPSVSAATLVTVPLPLLLKVVQSVLVKYPLTLVVAAAMLIAGVAPPDDTTGAVPVTLVTVPDPLLLKVVQSVLVR